MRLVFAGTPEVALPSLRALLASSHELVAVVTRPDAPAGRGRVMAPSPVAELAAEEGLEILRPDRPGNPQFLERLAEIAPDCCPVVAYGGLLPKRALDIPPRGWVNLHFSLLPAWRGAAPVQHALIAGDEVTGATTFRLVKELDAGPTYGLVTETVHPEDTAGSVLDRLATYGAGLLLATMDGIEDGSLEEREQPTEGVSFAPKLTAADGLVDWTRTAFAIDRQVRGCTPAPGAWTQLGDMRLKVGPTLLRADEAARAHRLGPGEVLVTKHEVLVGTGTYPVELGDVQPPGKPRMPAVAWARGQRSGPGQARSMTGRKAPDHSLARRARTRTPLDPARLVAYAALRTIAVDDAYLNLTLPTLLGAAHLSGRDAAFATELANGTVRMQGLYDAIIGACIAGGPGTLQPEVLIALRLGTHQLLSMRVPAHAAVGTGVELVREAVGERPVRLVNAVLRRIGATSLDDWVEVVAPRESNDPVARLGTQFSHPRWVVDAFADALAADGADATELPLLLAADNVAALVTIAVRPGLATVDGLASYRVEPGRFSPYAGRLAGGDPGDIPAVRAGTAGVQDEGSQLAALALSRAVGDGLGTERRWLDMCAGPGGKAALLAGLAGQRGATLVAAERLPHRALLVARALRAYPARPAVLAADATAPAWPAGAFDRVLVDAPCSGLGALRRRPEARWRRTAADLLDLVPLQRRLLETALDSVRVGGVVGYVTCSPHREETRGVVDTVLAGRSDVREEDARTLLPEVPDVGPGPHVQLWPHRHGTDAMFVTVLRRNAGRA